MEINQYPDSSIVIENIPPHISLRKLKKQISDSLQEKTESK